MKITKEISLKDFEAWSGARDTLNELTESECEQLESVIEELNPDGIDETGLNDILWFENDWIAECLGYKDWEHLERSHKGEDTEEHAREVLDERFPCAKEDGIADLIEQFIEDEWSCEMTDEEIIENCEEYIKDNIDEEENE